MRAKVWKVNQTDCQHRYVLICLERADLVRVWKAPPKAIQVRIEANRYAGQRFLASVSKKRIIHENVSDHPILCRIPITDLQLIALNSVNIQAPLLSLPSQGRRRAAGAWSAALPQDFLVTRSTTHE